MTLYYRSPEIALKAGRYSCAADVWSVACIIAEMAIGNKIFPGDSEIDLLYKMFKLLGTPNENIWPNLYQLKTWQMIFPMWKYQLDDYLKNYMDDVCIDLLSVIFILIIYICVKLY